MSRVIDISSQLTNARPVLKLSDEVELTINDRKNTMILVNAYYKKNKESDDLESVDKVLAMLLGKDGVKKLNDMDLSMTSYMRVFEEVMKAVSNDEEGKLEE